MSVYDDRPWLARYGDQPGDYQIQHPDALWMFLAAARFAPEPPAIRYFDAPLGTVDASVVAAAERLPVTQIAASTTATSPS